MKPYSCQVQKIKTVQKYRNEDCNKLRILHLALFK